MTDQLITLRASSLPLAFTCPGSVRRPKTVRVSPHNDAASAGTAAHEALQPLAEGGHIPWGSLDEIAARHRVNPVELRALAAAGKRLWDEVGHAFPGAMTEPEFHADLTDLGVPVILTGHLDLLSIQVNVARAGDWKSGRKDSNYAQQLRGYAALVLLFAPHLVEATVTALWLRTREIENYTMRHDELQRWLGELRETVVDWNGVYHPGDHCDHCPRWHECPGALEYARRSVAVMSDRQLLGEVECEIDKYTPDQLIEMKKRAISVRKLADRFDDAIRARVLQQGDIVGDHERVTVETSNSRDIDPLKAWPVLEGAGFESEDLAEVIKISASKMDDKIASKTPRGEKGRAIKQLTARLEEAGAITRTQTQRITIRRK